MTTIEGTIKIVAKTSGIVLEENPKVWYNPIDTELDVGDGSVETLKQLVLEELKVGQYVALSMTGEKTFFDAYKVLRQAPAREEKRETTQGQSIKGLKAHGIFAGDLDSLVALMNQFRENHNVKYSQFPSRVNGEPLMVILYYEES